MKLVKTRFGVEEISSCPTKEALTELLSQAASREVLNRTFREFGLSPAGLQFCPTEKLAWYLASELMMLRKRKPFSRKVRLVDRISRALRDKVEDMMLSISGATLAGMMVFMLAI